MQRHAAGSFNVLGEGILGENVEDAEGRAPDPRRRFHFSRIGPNGTDHQLEPETLGMIAEAMTAGGGAGNERSRVPAGYTYLGQFIAHDLSFDETQLALGTEVSPARMLQGRSPALDLDSLYGGGPGGARRDLYEPDGIHLRVGKTAAVGKHPAMPGFDLPRGIGSGDVERRTALIADERNDENVAVAQTHLAFIRFHNRVADSLAELPDGRRFRAARDLVTKHYQWMIREDYLRRICDPDVLADVFGGDRSVVEAGAPATASATMPIEFSIGTFRLGHSMVRSAYSWNRVRDQNVTVGALIRNSGRGGDLGGRDQLATTMIADFRRLYDLGDGLRRADPDRFNFAMRIDTRMVHHLAELAPGTFAARRAPRDDRESNLAYRNLMRARMVGLATGQQMARMLRRGRVRGVHRLSPEQIVEGNSGADLSLLGAKRRAALVKDTPLWFYVLREAEFNDGRLAGVGARILAETFHRAMQNSRRSIVRDRDWRPSLGRTAEQFDMTDLLLRAHDSDPHQLAPLEPRRPRG